MIFRDIVEELALSKYIKLIKHSTMCGTLGEAKSTYLMLAERIS